MGALMFTIRTSGDFFENLLEEFEDLQENPLSARHAINCAISAYHMHEWVWGDWLRKDDSTKISLGVTDKDSFVEWIDRHEPFFRAIAQLANGSKHFSREAIRHTTMAGTFDYADIDRDAFDTPRLEVEVDGRWVLAKVMFNDIIFFWQDFFHSYGPYSKLPTSLTTTESN